MENRAGEVESGPGWNLRKSAAVGEFEFRVRGVSGLRCASVRQLREPRCRRLVSLLRCCCTGGDRVRASGNPGGRDCGNRRATHRPGQPTLAVAVRLGVNCQCTEHGWQEQEKGGESGTGTGTWTWTVARKVRLLMPFTKHGCSGARACLCCVARETAHARLECAEFCVLSTALGVVCQPA